MTWQDVTLTIVSIIFVVSLLPQIYHGYKNKIGSMSNLTSVPTFLALYVTAGVYFSLHLYFSTVMTFLTGTSWLVLFVQRWLYGDKLN